MKISKRKMELSMARAKMNLYDLSEKSNVSIHTIGTVLARRSCKPATAGRIAEALGIDVTEILEDE